jgi:hypothetical protein
MIAKMPAIGGGRRRARVWLLWLDLAIAAHLLWVVALIADHRRTALRGLGAQPRRALTAAGQSTQSSGNTRRQEAS